MANVILLTGTPGCGKTTIIKKVINSYPGKMGGFYTQEIRENGIRTGFRMITLSGQSGILAHVNNKSQKRVGKYGVDLTALEEIGVKSIYQALESGALVVVNEIGPMEIASVIFQQAVNEVIQSGLAVVGTIARRRMPFIDKIKGSCSNIIEVGPHNRELIPGQILQTLAGGRNT